MRSIFYLLAILTGLSAPQGLEARLVAPSAVNAAELLADNEQHSQANKPHLLLMQRHYDRSIERNIRKYDISEYVVSRTTPVLFSDRARE